MRIKDALANIHKAHVNDELIPLYTTWGENLDKEHIEKSIEKASIIEEMINTKNKEYTKTLKNLNI